jgi:hypothetical protein
MIKISLVVLALCWYVLNLDPNEQADWPLWAALGALIVVVSMIGSFLDSLALPEPIYAEQDEHRDNAI